MPLLTYLAQEALVSIETLRRMENCEVMIKEIINSNRQLSKEFVCSFEGIIDNQFVNLVSAFIDIIKKFR